MQDLWNENECKNVANVYYEQDVDRSAIAERKVAILGYGSQGHAHALNLKESGINVCVGLRESSSSVAKATEAGLDVKSIADATAWADVVMLLLPDTDQTAIYEEHISPNLNPGDALAFSHGFNIRFDLISPPEDVDVIMVAPKGPGHLVRRTYADGIGGARAGVIETTFTEECETDLFGEQVVLCGGVTELVRSAFDILVDAGYQPEICYFECLHELKLIVDLMYEQGIGGMRFSVSDTAEYGDLSRGPRVIDDSVRATMREILSEIQSGQFAEEWVAEAHSGRKNFYRLEAEGREHRIEKVGEELRAMMPWISAGKVSVQDASGGQG